MGPPLVLDGAMGTELERRGIATPLPSWSAGALIDAPAAVLEVHRDYARAGADLLVTNTFRTLRRSLTGVWIDRAGDLVSRAVRLARQAADEEGTAAGGRPLVLGSMGPLADCFSPDLVPSEPELSAEHAERAADLAAAGVDGLLVETMGTRREALAAIAAANTTGLPVLTAFVADRQGNLLDGEELEELVPRLIAAGAAAVLVNCTPLATTAQIVPQLARLVGDLPFGVYANNGYAHPEPGGAPASTENLSPADYATHAAEWLAAGARLIGGCCGTSPAHIAALRRLIDTGAAGNN